MLHAKWPCFFHNFDPSSSSEQLKLPSRFVKHIEDGTSRTVTLVGPSGYSWLVNLSQDNDDLNFDNGWAAFVQDNFLEHGDALVFRYDGNLQFTVQVFDQSSCEKEAAFGAECSQDLNHTNKIMARKRERADASVPLDAVLEGEPKKVKGTLGHSERWPLDEMASATETHETAIVAVETGNCWSLTNNAISYAMPLQSAVPQNDLDTFIQNEKRCEQESSMVPLSTSEAEGLARSFSSCYPNFTKTMKAFNITGSYTLNIPYQFSMEHLPNCKVKIVLRNLKGETWTVNSIPTTKVNMSHTLCGGWMAFVRDNKINIGDICIFELTGKCELRVYILRVWKGEVESQNRPFVKSLAKGGAISSSKISGSSRNKLKGNACKVHLQRITKIDVSDNKGSRAKAFNGKTVKWNNTSFEEKKSSYTKGCISMKSAPEEKFAAQVFLSTLPHFVRVMKKFNISGSFTLPWILVTGEFWVVLDTADCARKTVCSYTCSTNMVPAKKIPYQFSMAHLPSCRTEIVLHNVKGQVWTVNSVPSTRVQTLHTFCGGWMAFVRGNDIQMGDICIFELIGKYEMRVHISGAGKMGLDYLSGKTVSNGVSIATSVSNRPI